MSNSTTLRDKNGRILGTIETQSNGEQLARDSHGHRVGNYDARQNITRDANGSRIGEGNLLAALIYDSN